MTIGEKIKEKITQKEWAFSELLQLNEVSSALANELYSELSTEDILNVIWDWPISSHDDGFTFGNLYANAAMEYLTTEIKKHFQKHFEEAKVVFTSKKEITPKQTKVAEKPKSLKKKIKKGDDGLDMPKGVKRL